MNGITATFTGRVGRDGELRHVKNGQLPMVSFSVAVDMGQRSSGATTWCRVVKFGEGAEALAPMLLKGVQVQVGGKLELQHWTAGDGTARSGLNVVATVIEIEGAASSTRDAPAQQSLGLKRAPRRAASRPATLAPGELDDDLSDIGRAP